MRIKAFPNHWVPISFSDPPNHKQTRLVKFVCLLLIGTLNIGLPASDAIAGESNCQAQPSFCNIDTDDTQNVLFICVPEDTWAEGKASIGAQDVTLQANAGARATLRVPCDQPARSLNITVVGPDGDRTLDLGAFVKAPTDKQGNLDLSDVDLQRVGKQSLGLSNVESLSQTVEVPGCGESLTYSTSDLIEFSLGIEVSQTGQPSFKSVKIRSLTLVLRSKTICGISIGQLTQQLRVPEGGQGSRLMLLDDSRLRGTLFTRSTASVASELFDSRFFSVDALTGTADATNGTVSLTFDGNFEDVSVVPTLRFWSSVILVLALICTAWLAFSRRLHRR